MKFIKITFEAVFDVDADCGTYIKEAVEQLRSTGAARAVKYEILEDQAAYDEWYKGPGIYEVEVPMPQIVKFD